MRSKNPPIPWVNRWMGFEIYFVHIGHGILFWLVIAIIALNVPWWAMLAGLPVIVFSIWGWFAEAQIVLPIAKRLLSEGDPEKEMTKTATRRPRG